MTFLWARSPRTRVNGESRFLRWRFSVARILAPGFEMSTAPLALDTCQRVSAFGPSHSFVIRHSRFRSQSCWAVDEFPWHPKSLRQMRSQRFHAENFRRVMSTQ